MGQNEVQPSKRLARYEALETYVRTQLLPYDFYLTPQQERELLRKVRSALEKEPDEALFDVRIKTRIEKVVDAHIEPWRQESYTTGRAERLSEVRRIAPDYVSAFITDPVYSSTIELMKSTFRIESSEELEKILKKQIRDWVDSADDRLIEQCDVVSIKDLVFAQLRSWC